LAHGAHPTPPSGSSRDDITGGAPEISEFFRYFVEIETKSHAYLPEYLAKHDVEVVASLPCYLEDNVDAQRGDGVFQKSISALKKLNAVGYGSTLPLTLVYNPIGVKLPPDKAELEVDYKIELKQRYGIVFTRLFAIINLPIARFAVDLREHGQWDYYMELLANSFNPATVDGLMCRSHMGEGILRSIAGDVIDVQSAGSRPAGFVHPMAIEVMCEIGIDISGNESKSLEEYLNHPVHTVITVCGNVDQICPVFPGQVERIHHGFDDPAHVNGTPDEVRAAFGRVRDEICGFLRGFAANFKAP
jgi:protein-tyrosine-phosphatase